MQKKVIKSKKPNTSNKKKSSSNTQEIKKRVIKKRTLSKNTKLALLLGCIAVLLLSYMTLGLAFAALMGVLLAIIVGIIILISKIPSDKKKRKVISIILIIILALCILFVILFSVFCIYIKIQADPLFKKNKLNTQEVSILYDKDGKQFAKLGSEKREKVSYEELPDVLVDAIVATEDSRFFQHNGFDAPRFFKAMLGQVLHRSGAGGASTLSMQVVKNSFTNAKADSGLEGIVRKFEDIYLAIFKLEKNYTKEQIIEFYVNNHFLGGNIYGVEEASQTYFGKSVTDLNLSEASILAGMFKSPNFYRPNVNPKNAQARRETVLYLMKRHGYINAEEEKLANSIPVDSLTVDASQASSNKYQGYIDTVIDELENKYNLNPNVTPLEIYTNLDRDKQDAVNKVLNGEGYNWINDKVQTGVSVLDSQTGKLLAIGNGRNRSGARQFNYATDIKRQPGSTAKPLFDYGPGIEYNNWSTYTLFDDAPYQYSNGKKINNWDNGYFGTITLRRALSTSRNIPALKAFQQVDNKKVIEFVTGLGIEPEIENGKIHEAHAIGAFTGVSPVQMSAAYAGFSNGGYYNEPYTVSKLIYRSTKKVIEHKQDRKQVMSDATAFMISSVLNDVSLTGGKPKNVSCKTGTTNYDENTMTRYNLPGDAIRDSWVVGYSTKTVIGMWYGYDTIDREYCLRNIPATVQKDKLFIALVNAGAMEGNREEFKQPSSVSKVGVAVGSNPAKLAGSGSHGVVYEYFKKGHEPEETEEAQAPISGPSNLKATPNSSKTSVKLTWSAVAEPANKQSNYGQWGYYIYKDGVQIDWASGTSYEYTGGSIYGSYKVVATYKSYNGIQSSGSNTVTIKDEPVTSPPIKETEVPTTATDPTTTP